MQNFYQGLPELDPEFEINMVIIMRLQKSMLLLIDNAEIDVHKK